MHKITPVTEDPIEALFNRILDDPDALMEPGAGDSSLVLGPSSGDEYEDLIGTVVEQDETSPRAAELPSRAPRLPQASEHGSKPRSPTVPLEHIREGFARLI